MKKYQILNNRRIRVLFIIERLALGGAEKQLIYLATNLDKSQFEVRICSLSTDSPLSYMLDNSGVKLELIPQTFRPDLSRPFKLIKLVKAFRPDIIHSFLFVSNTWARIVGSITGVPVIISERSSSPKKKILFRFIERILYHKGEILISNSISGAENIKRNKLFPTNKIYVIYNGIPIDKFIHIVDENQKNILKKQLGIDEKSKVIGIIANLSFPKNHELLFNSFSKIKGKAGKVQLLLIGDGYRRNYLENYAQSLGISEDVIFAGRRNDIPSLLSIIDLFVLPSRWEGFPNVLLEAMISSCPVIATKVGGVIELIEDNVTGFLVEPDNIDELSAKMNYVLNNLDQISNLLIRAKLKVIENYSIENMVCRTSTIYRQLLLNGSNWKN